MERVKGQPETAAIADLIHQTARECYFNGLRDEARMLSQKSMKIAESVGDVHIQAESLITLELAVHGNNYEESIALLNQAIGLAESAGLIAIAARAYHNLGVRLSGDLGDHRGARENFLKSADLDHRMGRASGELWRLSLATFQSLNLGELAEVEEILPSLRLLKSQIAEPGTGGLYFSGLEATLLRYRGELDEAIPHTRVNQKLTREKGDLQTLGALNNLLADMMIELERWDEAEQALKESTEIGDRLIGAAVPPRCQLSTVYARQGRVDDAKQILEEARAKARDNPPPMQSFWLSLASARLASAQTQWQEAFAAYENATKFLRERGIRWIYAQTLREWAGAHLARNAPGDRERARELLSEALEEFEEMKVEKYAEKVRQGLRADVFQSQSAGDDQAKQGVAM
ncbi:MAG: hypothetical protein KGJ80_14255 [Chloroflexota bacterium]|nr:hypothetical protein [Chloroflexota bacterium]